MIETSEVKIPKGTSLNSVSDANLLHHQTSQDAARRVLGELLNSFNPIAWEDVLGENPKQKHILVEIVARVLDAANKRRWGLAKRHDFIYVFTGKHWQQIEKPELKDFLAKAAIQMGYSALESRYFETQDKLLRQFYAEAYLPEPEPDPDKVLVNLQNGTLEITSTGTMLREHRPEDFLTYLLPFDYNPTAQADKFYQYLNYVLPNVGTQNVLSEFIGYCFLPGLKLEKVLLLYGSGANGKSVFFDVVGSMLGAENFCSYSLGHLNEEHNRAQIADKLLNYGSEINAGAITKDMFKMLASGEPVQARLKYGNPFQMTRYARLMFNANTLPSDVEQSEAYFRRFIIVPFRIQVPEANQDKNLSKKIISEELPGVFSWVLNGLNRLIKQQNFSRCDEAEIMLKQYKKESDSVAMFLEEGDEGKYTPSNIDYVKQDDLYSRYKQFCYDSGFRSVSVRKFKERLERFGFQIDRRNFGRIVYCKFETWN